MLKNSSLKANNDRKLLFANLQAWHGTKDNKL